MCKCVCDRQQSQSKYNRPLSSWQRYPVVLVAQIPSNGHALQMHSPLALAWLLLRRPVPGSCETASFGHLEPRARWSAMAPTTNSGTRWPSAMPEGAPKRMRHTLGPKTVPMRVTPFREMRPRRVP